MTHIWTVARQTLSHCFRTKTAVVSLIALGSILAGLPMLSTGDGTLAGSIRTVLYYGLMLIGLLLSLVTVIAGAGVITSDLRDKQIELLVVKPIPRWQYVVGRFLGVVLLDVILLGIAATGLYLVVQHLRGTEAVDVNDRRTIETDIFTARIQQSPDSPLEAFDAWVQRRVADLKKQNRYTAIIESYCQQFEITADDARMKLKDELLQEAAARYATTPPGGVLGWKFTDVRIADAVTRGSGQVEKIHPDKPLYRINAPASLVGRVVHRGPIEIEGVEGVAIRVDRRYFDVAFDPDPAKRSEIRDLKVGSNVSVTAPPTLQIRYKATPVGEYDGKMLYRRLRVAGPSEKTYYEIRGDGPINTPTTVTFPASSIPNGSELIVYYVNQQGPSPDGIMPAPRGPVQIQSADVSLLYRIGGFEMNYIRAVLLVFCQLVLLAAMTIFFGCFLSYPVVLMACLLLLVMGALADWLFEDMLDPLAMWLDPANWMTASVVTGIKIFLPSLKETSPAETLVDGVYIPWKQVGTAGIWFILVRTSLYLAVGCWVFHRREVARVQV